MDVVTIELNAAVGDRDLIDTSTGEVVPVEERPHRGEDCTAEVLFDEYSPGLVRAEEVGVADEPGRLTGGPGRGGADLPR